MRVSFAPSREVPPLHPRMRRLLPPLLLLCCAFSPLRAQPADRREGDPLAPIEAPFRMRAWQCPDLPARRFDIRDHGGVPGGAVKKTEAFAARMAAAAAADVTDVHVVAAPSDSSPDRTNQHRPTWAAPHAAAVPLRVKLRCLPD